MEAKVPALASMNERPKLMQQFFRSITMPTPEGVKTLLDDMAPRNPKPKLRSRDNMSI